MAPPCLCLPTPLCTSRMRAPKPRAKYLRHFVRRQNLTSLFFKFTCPPPLAGAHAYMYKRLSVHSFYCSQSHRNVFNDDIIKSDRMFSARMCRARYKNKVTLPFRPQLMQQSLPIGQQFIASFQLSQLSRRKDNTSFTKQNNALLLCTHI